MKFLPLAGSFSVLAFGSCALSTDKVAEEAPESSIPPPVNHLAQETSKPPQEELPDLTSSPAAIADTKEESSNEADDVTESGGYVFDDPLKTLPSQRDLSSPSSPSPSPSPIISEPKDIDESSLLDEVSKPVVINP